MKRGLACAIGPGYRRAGISLLLSAVSYQSFCLYLGYHFVHLPGALPHSRPGIGLLKSAADLTALVALVLAVITVIRGPRWLGIIAVIVALLACSSIPIMA
jgi:hypothetical protein